MAVASTMKAQILAGDPLRRHSADGKRRPRVRGDSALMGRLEAKRSGIVRWRWPGPDERPRRPRSLSSRASRHTAVRIGQPRRRGRPFRSKRARRARARYSWRGHDRSTRRTFRSRRAGRSGSRAKHRPCLRADLLRAARALGPKSNGQVADDRPSSLIKSSRNSDISIGWLETPALA